MRAVLRQRTFGLLWAAGLISVAGDWVIVSALPFFIYAQTHSPLAVGGMFAAYFAPRVLVSPLAGVFVDRWSRTRTLIAADLLRVPVLLLLLLVTSAHQLWLLYLVLFMEASVAQFFGPAKSALVPLVVRADELAPANALNALNNNLGRLVGAASAGVLLAATGLRGVVLLDAVTYLVSAALLAAMHPIPATHPTLIVRPATPPSRASLVQELREGLFIVGRDRMVRGLFVIFGITNFADSITSVLFIAFVQDVLHAGAPQLGWFLAAGAAGGMLGGVLVARFGRHLAAARLIALGGIAVGVCFAAMFALPSVLVTLLLSGLLAVPLTGMNVSGETALQQQVADTHRGRVVAVFNTVVGVLYVASMLLISLATGLLGVLPLLNGAALLYGVAGALAWLLLDSARKATVGKDLI